MNSESRKNLAAVEIVSLRCLMMSQRDKVRNKIVTRDLKDDVIHSV